MATAYKQYKIYLKEIFLKEFFPGAGLITNTQIKINNTYPEHADLHHPLIAYLLPQLPVLVSKKITV